MNTAVLTNATSPPAFLTTIGDTPNSISIRHHNTCRPQGRAERKKKCGSSVDIATETDDVVEEQQQNDFRTWYDSTGLHWLHGSLAFYKDGAVRLSSPDGTLFEIAEEKLSRHDLAYLWSQQLYKSAQPKVTFSTLFPSQSTDVIWSRMSDGV